MLWPFASGPAVVLRGAGVLSFTTDGAFALPKIRLDTGTGFPRQAGLSWLAVSFPVRGCDARVGNWSCPSAAPKKKGGGDRGPCGTPSRAESWRKTLCLWQCYFRHAAAWRVARLFFCRAPVTALGCAEGWRAGVVLLTGTRGVAYRSARSLPMQLPGAAGWSNDRSHFGSPWPGPMPL